MCVGMRNRHIFRIYAWKKTLGQVSLCIVVIRIIDYLCRTGIRYHQPSELDHRRKFDW